MIECKNINLSFDGKHILKDLSLSVNAGEHVSISGVSGKGKSTLLKLLQGYVMKESGEVVVNSQTLSPLTVKEIRNDIAWIPQNINLPVENGHELLRMMQAEGHIDTIIGYMQDLGLEANMLEQGFQKLSIGQKQRLVIATCLALDKKIILMDEPTASLDEGSVKQLIACIKSLTGKTIVSASHHQTWLKSADKTIKL